MKLSYLWHCRLRTNLTSRWDALKFCSTKCLYLKRKDHVSIFSKFMNTELWNTNSKDGCKIACNFFPGFPESIFRTAFEITFGNTLVCIFSSREHFVYYGRSKIGWSSPPLPAPILKPPRMFDVGVQKVQEAWEGIKHQENTPRGSQERVWCLPNLPGPSGNLIEEAPEWGGEDRPIWDMFGSRCR